MSSKSERGFGARLQNAQNLKTYLQGFANYNPARPEDTVAEYEKLLQQCADSNTATASTLQDYTLIVKTRSDAFTGNSESTLKKLLSPISKFVQAQYGKTSREYTSIANMIGKMRATKLIKPTTETDDNTKNNVSQSELSFGSQLQNFKDLITSLKQLPNFNPSHTLLKTENLQNIAEQITRLNQEVINKTLPLKQAREQRNNLFAELSTRTQRIKSYVSAQYGNQSIEYKSISKLKI
jgi:hypothetical protein